MITAIHPAATVVLLRDGTQGCEVLLVRRNAQLSFHGGAWVFPGGRIDAEDLEAAGRGADIRVAARHAAVREAREEAGLRIEPDSLLLFSRWVTPVNVLKRFDTWFFAAPAGAGAVQVDGGEIDMHRWFRPREALAARARSEIDLPPPTFVTLTQLDEAADVAVTLQRLSQRPFEHFEPQLHVTADGACTLYHGDAAYGSTELDRPGPRHRLWMRDGGWYYERSGGPA
jgi:8-oxo-dGTP pyrophosphatase MutT (NUDIX family)